MSYFWIFLAAFFLNLVLVLLALKFFPKCGLMDKPQKYGIKRSPIPYSGGILIFMTFLICLGLFLNFDKHLWGVIIGAGLIVLISFLDDRFDLNPVLRLSVQLLAALIIVLSGIGIEVIRNPLGGSIFLNQIKIPVKIGEIFYHLTLFADLFTIFWILGMVNTMNWMDGVNGMAGGVSFIGFLILFFLSIRSGMHAIDQSQVATMSIILAGASLAFLIFEFYPAKILMGDAGSMFLGFMIAVLAIFSGGKVATAFLVMGFPILDAMWVFGRRILQRKSPLKGDLRHFHHRLIEAGFSPRQALLIIYSICAVFGGVALFLGSEQKLIAIIVMGLMMVLMGLLVVRRKGGARH